MWYICFAKGFDLGVDDSDDEVRAAKNKLGMFKLHICYEWGRRGSGAMFSLVSGMGGPDTAANVVTSAFSLHWFRVDCSR
ncbi:hypothetical protein AgCh_029385 [Apium graveolens]